jgi:long-chain acyl-CoA synthetase
MMVSTLPALLRHQAGRLGPRTALRHKRFGLYQDISWQDHYEQVTAGAAALIQAGIAPGDRVGTLAENRVEWLVADLATQMVGAVTVPLHASLSPQQVHYQLFNAGVRLAFVSNREQHDKVAQVRADLPALVGMVAFDAVPGASSWPGFVQAGRAGLPKLQAEIDRRLANLQADDLATIMYTSGTTGNPKGVMLTQGNLLSNATALHEAAPCGPDAVFLNWLPFSHIYARTCDVYSTMVAGVTLALADSPETVVLNVAETQPTHMSSVPRFYEKVLGAVQGSEPAQARRRLRGLFGMRIDWLGSGGAPLPSAVAKAYQAAGLLLLQGYGLTESSPVITFNRKERHKFDSVGIPVPGVEVKIAEDGEVLTRGPHVMRGYWQDPESTAAAIRDGWLHTGDLGRLDDDGFLYITGRKKDLLVLSNGKKVVPNHIEGLLLADPCVDQVVVCGEARNFLTALIVPRWPQVRQALSLDSESEEDLARDPRVVKFLTERMQKALTVVSSWEQVRKFVIVPQPFSVAADEMTVSLKLRRGIILDHHHNEIEAVYHDTDLEPAG